jgi:flagellar hook-associated protein 3 FlgL
MQLNNVIAENDQYIKNIGQAQDWIDGTETALNDATNILHRTVELATKGANGTLTQSQMGMIRDEVVQLRDHLVQLGNSSMGGRYIFSGYQTTSPAFNNNGTYLGDQNQLAIEISQGIKMDYSVPGDRALKESIDALDNMVKNLEAGNSAAIGTTNLSEVNKATDNLLTLRSQMGAKVTRLDLAKNRYEDLEVKHTELLSEYEDIDLAETIMELRIAETTYRTALASGARIIQPTLLDFLK